ncbi:L,D-transpeptidase [Pseudenhygromyxa sp. WMMC2535]|uniref:L,D-transpeptidase family protein n=1 Tax=Pseudenhygromyxa sp. WMMC2535 TaxID=2712867 RepID=UPI001554DEAB|nr:L,D-transpeptidase family protein [Pseudenhygromyxa sp. WMMC2535]NVB41549.1 L,D-transpeptidase [Pseudenhygromyxa sp. WMMC2535]
MDTQRALEIFGGFLIGAGVTVAGYELAGPRAPASQEVAASEDEEAGDEATLAQAGATPEKTRGPAVEEMAAAGAKQRAAEDAEVGAPTGPFAPDADGHYSEFTKAYYDPVAFTDEHEAEFPKHGLVTAGAVIVRERADLESNRIGMLRAGTRVRVDAERSFGGGCSSGWHEIFPEGWICVGAGLEVSDTPPDDGTIDIAQPNVGESMPLDYWRVNHDGTPFFHRLPSYTEQDQADAAANAWLAAHGREPMPTDRSQRPDDVPAVVKEYLNAGYYVTVTSEHVHAKRHFLKTNRGVYVRKYQLGKKDGSDFRGQVLGPEQNLPVYFIVRELELMSRVGDSGLLESTGVKPERRTTHPFSRKVRIGDYDYYEDDEGNLMRAYAVAAAEKIKRPTGLSADERWIHVDLSEQTLVAYIGDTPVFATIVSTGKEPGMTPVGVHRVQSKFIVTSMRDQPVEEEAYSIEDVPWTQYFSNSVALHGAFWHGGFGLVRSHGCVNLSPADARWLFGFTEPKLPEGWAAAMPGVMGAEPSAVVVTE